MSLVAQFISAMECQVKWGRNRDERKCKKSSDEFIHIYLRIYSLIVHLRSTCIYYLRRYYIHSVRTLPPQKHIFK